MNELDLDINGVFIPVQKHMLMTNSANYGSFTLEYNAPEHPIQASLTSTTKPTPLAVSASEGGWTLALKTSERVPAHTVDAWVGGALFEV